MNVQVDQRCPSCGTGIHDEAELEAISGVGMLRELTANWECPSCGVAYDQTVPVDMDVVDQSGFESWVGSFEGDPCCLIVSEGSNSDEHGRGMSTAERGETDFVEDESM